MDLIEGMADVPEKGKEGGFALYTRFDIPSVRSARPPQAWWGSEAVRIPLGPARPRPLAASTQHTHACTHTRTDHSSGARG